MHPDRRALLALSGLALSTLALPGALTAWADTGGPVIDALGRRVTLRRPVNRIVLLDAIDVLSMAALHPAPSDLLAGWANIDKFDSDLVRRQYEVRTDGRKTPVIGGQTADTVSVEKLLALEPDLVVATAYMEPGLGDGVLTRRLEAAGIPVIFSNAASNRPAENAPSATPFDDMARTLRMWGAVLDRGERAEAFIAFVQERLVRVQDRVRGIPPVKTYLEVQSTDDDCCWAAGQRIWGDLLAMAGGRNLSAVTAPWYAKIAVEQLMAEAPAVYIASGGAFGAGVRPGIGPGLDPVKAQEGLRRLIARTGLATLPAVRDGRVHGVWTGLLTAPPLHILFVESVATWLHPDAFHDIDPADTLADLNRRFLAKPLPGPCWTSLPAARTAGSR